MNISKQRFLKRIGYEFNDPELLELALTHRSCGSKNNERLEFLGDAALDFIIGYAIYQRLPDSKEGELSRYRASLVKGVTLTEIATELQLGEHLHLGGGEMKSGGHRRASILADTVEAIIGAIYIDSDMASCERCVLQWFDSRLENLDKNGQKDSKTQLQEYMQARGHVLPIYEVVNIFGEAHSQEFTVECRIELLRKPTTGQGSSRRNAEKQAAEMALKRLLNDR
ncbi:MAG: ribonuclease III [Porticoccaceae bacterium]|nr:MAG: ribonuclease III [Porticoccaceae bacterium]